MTLQKKPLGYFHAVGTRDAVAQARDGWPYFVLNRRGLAPDGQALYEVQFGDGEWMLAVASDLAPV